MINQNQMKGSSESSSTGLNTSGASGGYKSLSHSDYVRSLQKDGNLGLDDDSIVRALGCEDVSLRQWLDNLNRSIDAVECFHVFRQIVKIVNAAHSQGIVVHNVRPSCFVISSFNHVSFIESASWSDEETKTKSKEEFLPERRSKPLEELKKQLFPMKHILAMEMSWYTSSEEDNGSTSNCASDVYRLGVLLFELFCPVSSREEKLRTMSSLRHRVLPPQIWLSWPKEAAFCLWLFHPEPSYRPSMIELLQSEFFNEPRENLEEREAAMELRDRIEEHELLLEFLMLIQQREQEAADKLRDTVSLLSSDIDEVVKRQLGLKQKGSDVPSFLVSRKGIRQGVETAATEDNDDNTIDEESKLDYTLESTLLESSRFLTNIKKLESVYFATRYRQIKAAATVEILLARYYSALSSNGRTSEKSSVSNSIQPPKDPINDSRQRRWIDTFLESLSKYLSFSKLSVKAYLKQGDLLISSNLVCAIAFDRDGEFFATAGVNKKIKIFECESIIKYRRDIHYPVVELASWSKLSGICWNSYIKSQIASSNFEGVVQIWDVARSQLVTEMKEHEKRVWSIDISSADPALLASGNDGSVKLWSINQGVSIGTIKTKANVCCVQFPSDSGRSLAFSSADHKVYYYDLRNPKLPLCTMIGHNKTVSYVRFVDSSTLVSSSTDNTMKLWELSMSVSGINETPLHSFNGHTNVKNFVGLSVSDGYIATGSETNEVFVYHKAFPMPVLSYKFKTIDPVLDLEVDCLTVHILSLLAWTVLDLSRCKLHRQHQDSGDDMNKFGSWPKRYFPAF